MAKLPETYIAARAALAKCARIDECRDWEAKAEALRSYAVQMKDETLISYSSRIKARAVQRGGELLLAMKANKGGQPTHRNSTGAGGHPSRKQAAAEAGLSLHRAKTMMRVASVSKDLANRMIEGSPPATVNMLAKAGTKKNIVKPLPYRAEWSDWTNAVRHLSGLPACGLDVLAARIPTMNAGLTAECRNALIHLKLWLTTLEAATCQNAEPPAS